MNYKADKPVFIVGMNGSGTTMLADCLNNHSKIYIHKVETRVIPYYAHIIDQFGDLKEKKHFEKLVRDFADNYAFRVVNQGKKLDMHFDHQKLNHPSLSSAISLTFSYFAQKEGKPRWGDHSPKYALFIPVILDLFPDAKIIHIFRDGRDCSLSFRNRFRQNIYRAIHEWKTIVKQARLDGAMAGENRYFEIQYEALTADPENYMKAICSFLETPYDDRVLISKMPMYREKEKLSTDQQKGTLVQNFGKWQKHFSKKEIQKLEHIAGKTLGEMGYSLMYEGGDQDLSGIRLKMLKAVDQVNASIAFFQRYKGNDRWGTFLRGIGTSLKQGKTR